HLLVREFFRSLDKLTCRADSISQFHHTCW
ncbi:hypothetical protein D049_3412B, partial [Vibrio parahaemolyticus VPTS-2010]